MKTLSAEASPRLFSVEQLAKLLELTSDVDCECPNHLAGIVSGLVAFEDYAAACEDSNEADRELHAHLYRETARAREIMEVALRHLVDFEKIEV